MLSNFVDDTDWKQSKDCPIDKLGPGKVYNKCIFVVTEMTAEEMLQGKIRIAKNSSVVALRIPQANLQTHWENFRPTQHQVSSPELYIQNSKFYVLHIPFFAITSRADACLLCNELRAKFTPVVIRD